MDMIFYSYDFRYKHPSGSHPIYKIRESEIENLRIWDVKTHGYCLFSIRSSTYNGNVHLRVTNDWRFEYLPV